MPLRDSLHTTTTKPEQTLKQDACRLFPLKPFDARVFLAYAFQETSYRALYFPRLAYALVAQRALTKELAQAHPMKKQWCSVVTDGGFPGISFRQTQTVPVWPLLLPACAAAYWRAAPDPHHLDAQIEPFASPLPMVARAGLLQPIPLAPVVVVVRRLCLRCLQLLLLPRRQPGRRKVPEAEAL